MNYIVMDLEWNRPLSRQRMIREPVKLNGEIIQFGAARIDNLEDMNIIDRFSEIVRPIYYTKMNKEVTSVTDLTDETILQGRPFEEVCNEFLKWCGDEYVFITWSGNDAMWKFGIKPERTHDALNDAINTVEVMKRLDFSEGLEGYEV